MYVWISVKRAIGKPVPALLKSKTDKITLFINRSFPGILQEVWNEEVSLARNFLQELIVIG